MSRDKKGDSGEAGKGGKLAASRIADPLGEPVSREFRLLVLCFFGTIMLILLIVTASIAGLALGWLPEPVVHVLLQSVAQPLAYAVIVFLSVVLSPRIARAIRILRGIDNEGVRMPL
jgi:hypothetical protein